MQDRIELFETTRCLCLASRRAARTITRTFDQALRGHGLRATQFSLLSALQLKGPQSIGELAELLGNERTTVTRNLGIVVEHGWARIEPAPTDARSRIARITATGRRALEEALPTWREVQSSLVASMGSEAVASLHRLAGGPCTLDMPTTGMPPAQSEPQS